MVILTLRMNNTEHEYDIGQLTISKQNVKKIYGPENSPGDYLCRMGFSFVAISLNYNNKS